MFRNTLGMTYLANQMLDAFFAENGWLRDSLNATEVLASVVAGEFTIPQHIHDRICGCQRQHHTMVGFKNPRDAHHAQLDQMMAAHNLPRRNAATPRDGFFYFAESNATRKHCQLWIHLYRGPVDNHDNHVCYAYWSMRDGWGLRIVPFGKVVPLENPPQDATEALEMLVELGKKLR